MIADPVREGPAAYDALARRDADLAALIASVGTPDPFSWGVLEDAAGGWPQPIPVAAQ